MRRYLFGIIFGVILAAFTVYVALDTFVIVRVYQEIPEGPKEESSSISLGYLRSSETEEEETSEEPASDPTEGSSGETIEKTTEEPTEVPTVVSDDSYSDKNISIRISRIRVYETEVYIAEVELTSPWYLKTALAHDVYGRNVVNFTSETAKQKNAILAVNGDYYGARERGYVIRNGVLYRNSRAGNNQTDLVIYWDGSFGIIKESEVSAESLIENNAREVFSFGPALVRNGEISVGEREEVAIAYAKNPRCAVGIIDDLHYLFVVSDGRTKESSGLSLYRLAGVMKELGCETAYNLDGGGSATMVFNGEIINKPTGTGDHIYERQVSDIVYIGY
ncbi:MAG: phosphodiester glycosidase family protein [Lachnospiraceae bacterium]|nr:phosphodiester glycosidase family protein [Lachnospiraceae bacterium]